MTALSLFPEYHHDNGTYSSGIFSVPERLRHSTTTNNDFRTSVTEDALRGRTLRYSYPKELYPWHVRDSNGEWTGLSHRFFVALAERGRFNIEYVEPNNYSYSLMEAGKKNTTPYQIDNAWDACTHSVMMGYIDVCPATAWETPNRRNMSLFAAAVLTSNFRLLVKQVLDDGHSSWNPLDGYGSLWFSFLKTVMTAVIHCASVCIASKISHPKLEENAEVYSSSTEVFDAFVRGGCDAYVAPDHDVRARRDFQLDLREENLMLVGEPLSTMTVGTPIGCDIGQAYSLLSL